MKHAETVTESSLNRLLEAAETAWDGRDFSAALEYMETARRSAPTNVGILLRLGQMQGHRLNYPAAEQCFDEAVRLTPHKTDMLIVVANHCQSFRSPELEERFLRQAVSQPDATPLAFLKQGEHCERRRQLGHAAEFAERALKKNPAYPAAMLLRARLEKSAGHPEAAESILRSFLHQPIPLLWTKVQSWYELGVVLDRQERYDEAMQAVLAAKEIHRAEAAKNFGPIKIRYEHLSAMQSRISAGLLRKWCDQGSLLTPPRRIALLAGYPRSGTTLLEQVLDAHPDVTAAEETDVFINESLPILQPGKLVDTPIIPMLLTATTSKLQSARAAYFQVMEKTLERPVEDRLLIDKNPFLTSLIPAFLRVFPEARYLVALRDPRDVLLSRFLMPQPLVPHTTPFLTLEGTAENYAVTMGLWRHVSSILPAPWLEVRYEDMVEDLESVARKTLEFLGVPWNAKVLGFDEHASKKMVRSPTYADVTQPLYTRARGRWRNYQKYLEPHFAKLEPFVKAFGYE